MPFVNVSLDVGAAMNAYKLTWNYPEKFRNVIIHLGDFHFIKENFGVIGKIVTNSRFEDVVSQAGICSTGSLKGILVGSHYNRAWTVHLHFSLLGGGLGVHSKNILNHPLVPKNKIS